MNLNRKDALGISTLAEFSCQLARHFLNLRALGQPSLVRLAADLQITAQEHDQIKEEAATDYYVWGIAGGADVPSLLAGRALGWIEFWDSMPWTRKRPNRDAY